MSTYLDFIPSPASIKAGDTEVHTGNPVDQVTITGDANDFGVVIANQATDGDARITFSNNDRSYTLGLNGVSGSTNEDFRIVVGNNIDAGTNVLSANHLGHLTIGRTTLTGGLQLRARTVTANTTLVNDTDHIIFADATSGNIVLTLPANNSNADGSSTVGKEYIIVKTDSTANTVQIKGSAGMPGDTVNGSTNYLLRSQNETATVVRSSGSSWLVTASNKLPYFGDGSTTNPSISFESDPNTGVYLAGSDQFGITTGGASRMVISSAGINVQNHKITNLDTPTANNDAATKAYVDGILTNVPVGTVGAAGLAFVGDPNTGIYQPNADQFGITTGGTSRMVISSAGINVQNHKITSLGTPTANNDATTKAYVDGILTNVPAGTVSTPSFSFTGDTNTGIYRPGADQFGITTGGTSRMVISSAGIDVQNHKITNLDAPVANNDAATKAYVDGILTNVPVGTVGAAGLSFTGDPDTGIYRPGADQFGITTGGASRMVISSAGINVQNHKITNLGTPTADTDAVTKAYVDTLHNNRDNKDPVRVATTAAITLSGLQTIDGVSLSAGDRVLVKNQDSGQNNGIYVVSSGTWSRATDADGTPSGKVSYGMHLLVVEGTVNKGTGFVLTTSDPIVVGTTPLTFEATGNAYSAGDGITVGSNGVIAVDSTVIRSNATQTIEETTTFEELIIAEAGIQSPGPSASQILGNWIVPAGSAIYPVGGTVLANGPNASTTEPGLVELATNAETLTGTDTTRAVTPASLRAKFDSQRVTVFIPSDGTVTLNTVGFTNVLQTPLLPIGTWEVTVHLIFRSTGDGIQYRDTSSGVKDIIHTWPTSTGDMKGEHTTGNEIVEIPHADFAGTYMSVTSKGIMLGGQTYTVAAGKLTNTAGTPSSILRGSCIICTKISDTPYYVA